MEQSYLTDEQISFFLDKGYVHLSECFTREQAAEWSKDVWKRLGKDPRDKSTWGSVERINMPDHRSMSAKAFAPKAWGAICELLGGEERISPETSMWTDGFIVNLGLPEYENQSPTKPQDLDGWHCDGDFFMHFLDSPEQGLLVIPLWSDVVPHGGGTFIAPDSIPLIASHLNDDRRGVHPTGFGFPGIRDQCTDFVELTGRVGDVILLHPLMLHSASHNNLRAIRVITNPPVKLKEPFCFDRIDPAAYSIVERKTMLALGVDPEKRGLGYKTEGERQEVIPERVLRWRREKQAELDRLAGTSTADAAQPAAAITA